MRCAAALPLFAASLIGSSSFPECANAQSNPYALDRLFLEEPNTTPLYGVLSFNSYAAVANYYGDTSSEATLASEFFAGYNGSSANMLFTRLPYLPARAHLLGSHLVDPTLAEFRSGTLSIISEDYKYSGSVNFSGLKNLTGAAGVIQRALNQKLPVAAVTTGSSIAPVSVSFTGSIDYDVLKVTALSSGSVQIGSLISGPGVPSGTQITGQITGTPNGVGIYSLFVSEGTIASEPMKETYGVLTVGSTSSGKVKIGQQVAGVLPDTAIETSLNGSGPGTSWVVNNAQTVTSQSLTMTGAPLTVTYNSVTGATKDSGFFKIQQNDDFNYQSSSLTYATGTAARSLGLTKASGAFDSTPGLIVTPKSDRECPTGRYTKTCVSVAAFMNDFSETESDQWSSFQMAYDPTAPTTPGEQAALAAWASDGNSCFLENWSATTPAIVDSPTCAAQLFARPGAAVPEPSTWAMVLLGFVGLGFAVCRRSRAATIPAAV